jgi:hypothetical protein
MVEPVDDSGTATGRTVRGFPTVPVKAHFAASAAPTAKLLAFGNIFGNVSHSLNLVVVLTSGDGL